MLSVYDVYREELSLKTKRINDFYETMLYLFGADYDSRIAFWKNLYGNLPEDNSLHSYDSNRCVGISLKNSIYEFYFTYPKEDVEFLKANIPKLYDRLVDSKINGFFETDK